MLRNIVRIYKKLAKWVPLQVRGWLFGRLNIDYFDIPIVINNFNRVETLKLLIDGLQSRGYHNIHIIDNRSTYPPLLDYYATCPYTVYRLPDNVGYLSVWQTGIFRQFTHSYFAYTDSDLQIHEQCPADFIERFVRLLKKYPSALKVGFSLALDDLPDCYAHKASVVEWESRFWLRQIEPNVYKAPIDTTFAVYKPFFKGEAINFAHRHLRVGFPYTMRHLPWYVDSSNLSAQEQYYVDNLRTVTHWSEKAID